jgi:hypothetical protein
MTEFRSPSQIVEQPIGEGRLDAARDGGAVDPFETSCAFTTMHDPPHDHDHDHSHDHGHLHDHGHTHEVWSHAGLFRDREPPRPRSFTERAFTIGIGGPVGSGKTALLLAINKTDLAPHVGADLAVMDRDARRMRGDGPIVFAQCNKGVGLDAIVGHLLSAWQSAVRPRM